MDTQKIEQEYNRLIRVGMQKGTIGIRGDAPEFRDSPRFEPMGAIIAVKVEPRFTILNISASGIAFLSNLPFLPGSILTLVLEDVIGVQARVISCEMIETDEIYLETRYRAQCSFDTPNHGKQMLLMMDEMEKLPS